MSPARAALPALTCAATVPFTLLNFNDFHGRLNSGDAHPDPAGDGHVRGHDRGTTRRRG
ncbi:MAG: hypothetical protein IPL43_12705 [Micropruina sp.]|nr:hypothetical protein [Micropruina sp.]